MLEYVHKYLVGDIGTCVCVCEQLAPSHYMKDWMALSKTCDLLNASLTL